jgi:hypothetical protein
VAHKLVVDPWSMAVLMDDFRLLYHVENYDQRLSLPPPSCQVRLSFRDISTG